MGPTKEQEECAAGFRRYERKTGPNSFQVLQGQLVDRTDGKVCVRVEDGRVVEVPPGFKRVFVEPDTIFSLFCKPHVDRANLEASGAMGMSDWIEASKRHWMTLADVAALPPGKPLQVVMFHRNVGDLCADESANPRGRAVRPARFFRKCVVTFVPDNDGGGTKGVVQFTGEDEREKYPLELDVEYKNDQWYPLENGYLPASDSQGFAKLWGRKVHWSKMSKHTHVGWRGPMVRLEAVKDPGMPSVFFGTFSEKVHKND